MDNLIREMCRLVCEYHSLRYKAILLSDKECKDFIKMKFPVVQGLMTQNELKRIGEMKIDYKSIGKEIEEYLSKHTHKKDCAVGNQPTPKPSDDDLAQSLNVV